MISYITTACIAASLVLLVSPGGAAHASPKVVVSIAPIHSLVDSIMEGVGSPTLVLTASQSPHHASLSPSAVRAVSQAELMIWVGPQLEGGLVRIVDQLAPGHVLGLSVKLVDSLLQNRGSTGNHGDNHDHEVEGLSNLHQIDPHFWLSAVASTNMVDAVTESLSVIDPANAISYQRNANALRDRLDAWRRNTEQHLVAVRNQPFMVYHDAYQYFEQEFSLNAVSAVTVNPDRAVGAKRLLLLRQVLANRNLRCLFTEPQFEPEAARVLVEGTTTRIGILDPLGVDLEPGPDMWFQLMDNMVDDFLGCMQPN